MEERFERALRYAMASHAGVLESGNLKALLQSLEA